MCGAVAGMGRGHDKRWGVDGTLRGGADGLSRRHRLGPNKERHLEEDPAAAALLHSTTSNYAPGRLLSYLWP